MDSPPENFENLRRLLAWKRHEQPPPGYFDGLARDILVSLHAGEGARDVGWELLGWEAPWLQRLWEFLGARPGFTGALGAAACAVVLAGVLYAERPDSPALPDAGMMQAAMPGGAGPDQLVLNHPFAQPDAASSTNPVAQPVLPSSLFGGPIQGVQRVNDLFRPN